MAVGVNYVKWTPFFDLTVYLREHEMINNVFFCEVMAECLLSGNNSAEKYWVKWKRTVTKEKWFTFRELCYTSFKQQKKQKVKRKCSTCEIFFKWIFNITFGKRATKFFLSYWNNSILQICWLRFQFLRAKIKKKTLIQEENNLTHFLVIFSLIWGDSELFIIYYFSLRIFTILESQLKLLREFLIDMFNKNVFPS